MYLRVHTIPISSEYPWVGEFGEFYSAIIRHCEASSAF